MNLVHNTMESCRAQQCYEVLLNMLLTKLNDDILVQNVKDCLKTRNENFVSALKSVRGSSPFLQNESSVVHKLTLRCLQTISLIGVATTEELISDILSLTKSSKTLIWSLTSSAFSSSLQFSAAFPRFWYHYGIVRSKRAFYRFHETPEVSPIIFLAQPSIKPVIPWFFLILNVLLYEVKIWHDWDLSESCFN